MLAVLRQPVPCLKGVMVNMTTDKAMLAVSGFTEPILTADFTSQFRPLTPVNPAIVHKLCILQLQCAELKPRAQLLCQVLLEVRGKQLLLQGQWHYILQPWDAGALVKTVLGEHSFHRVQRLCWDGPETYNLWLVLLQCGLAGMCIVWTGLQVANECKTVLLRCKCVMTDCVGAVGALLLQIAVCALHVQLLRQGVEQKRPQSGCVGRLCSPRDQRSFGEQVCLLRHELHFHFNFTLFNSQSPTEAHKHVFAITQILFDHSIRIFSSGMMCLVKGCTGRSNPKATWTGHGVISKSQATWSRRPGVLFTRLDPCLIRISGKDVG